MATAAPEFTWEQAHILMEQLAAHAHEWAGLPMPTEGSQIILHPSYPFAEILSRKPPTPPHGQEDILIVNQWFSPRLGALVVIFRENGRFSYGCIPEGAMERLEMALRTLGEAPVWKMEAELKAQMKLSALVSAHAFKTYMFTGSFLETSRRSGVTYLFRRNRPTVALRERQDAIHYLASLCLHPIGYYAASWAGVLCPTDEVIAHLLLMRGDEHRFWKQSGQHSINRPQAGV